MEHLRFEWSLSDGTKAPGPFVEERTTSPVSISETLKVSDARGNLGYDFAIVEVIDRTNAEPVPPAIHAAYYPTLNLHPSDAITFKVRTFATTHGEETWDFGDGSPSVATHSDGNVEKHAPNGYASTIHRYDRPATTSSASSAAIAMDARRPRGCTFASRRPNSDLRQVECASEPRAANVDRQQSSVNGT